jgi:hypothetical protein
MFLRRMFDPEKDEVMAGCRKWHNNNNLYFPSNVNTIMSKGGGTVQGMRNVWQGRGVHTAPSRCQDKGKMKRLCSIVEKMMYRSLTGHQTYINILSR